ncbi:MAG: hypothetical protein FJX57_16260 [Alphaproteobacteria bacterium]|nr:hypothetical protein [Alphaproteobacteria bacterium]
MPWTVYSGRSNRGEFSFFLGSWGVNTGETSNPMIALNATFNREAGTGASNARRYSNPKLDELLQRATTTLDDTRRNRMLAEASEIVFDDVAIIPLHQEMLVLGARRGITYQPRADQYTLAMGVTPSR